MCCKNHKRIISLFISACLLVVLPVLLYAFGVFPRSRPYTDSFLSASGSSIGGDINGDGRRNIFDLLSLLTVISGESSYSPAADLDGNAKADIFDLLVMLKLLSRSIVQEDKLEFVLALGTHQIIGSRLLIVDNAEDCESIPKPVPVKRRLRFYSNKPIEEFFFVFGGDTLHSPEEKIGFMYDPDTLGLADSILIDPFKAIKIVTRIPWHLRLRAADGTKIDSSGTTECQILFCIIIDGLFTLLSREIDFPLVLEGAPQSFTVFMQGPVPRDTIRIDLNPENSGIVIYPDIDSLVTAINACIKNHKSKDGKPGIESWIDFGPAVDLNSGRKTSRLALEYPDCFIIYPLDGNEELTDKLGFPAWLPRDGCFIDLGYGLMKD